MTIKTKAMPVKDLTLIFKDLKITDDNIKQKKGYTSYKIFM